MIDRHTHFMQEALKEAQRAFKEDEVPIGAVIVANDRIIARAYNQVERLHDVTAHAEMVAITSAANHLGSKYLEGCSLYVTVEPCLMCASAIYWSRLSNLYYGASDNRFGYTQKAPALFGKNINIFHDILKDECAALVLEFFRRKREMDDLK